MSRTGGSLEFAVQQELDFLDLCPVCGKQLDDCMCPETRETETGDRTEARPPATYRHAWECPYCNHLNTELNRYCQECGEMYGEALQ